MTHDATSLNLKGIPVYIQFLTSNAILHAISIACNFIIISLGGPPAIHISVFILR